MFMDDKGITKEEKNFQLCVKKTQFKASFLARKLT